MEILKIESLPRTKIKDFDILHSYSIICLFKLPKGFLGNHRIIITEIYRPETPSFP